MSNNPTTNSESSNAQTASSNPPPAPTIRRSSHSQSSLRSSSSKKSTASLPPPIWRVSFFGSSTSTAGSHPRGPAPAAPAPFVPSPLANPVLSTSPAELPHRSNPSADPQPVHTNSPRSVKDRLRSLVPNSEHRNQIRLKRQRVASTASQKSVSIGHKDSDGVFTIYSEESEMVTMQEEVAVDELPPPAPESMDVDETSKEAPPPPAPSVPFPTQSSPTPTPPQTKSTSNRAGWFSSISRATARTSKGKEKERNSILAVDFTPPDPPPNPEPQPPTVSQVAVEASTSLLSSADTSDSVATLKPATLEPSTSGATSHLNTPRESSGAETPVPPVTPPAKKTTWFGYSSPSPESALPAPSSPNQVEAILAASPTTDTAGKRASISVSSVDDSVPPSPQTPSSPAHQQLKIYSTIRPDLKVDSSDSEDDGSGTTKKRERKLSSLNPSTSRFSLGVVLLGRGGTNSPAKQDKDTQSIRSSVSSQPTTKITAKHDEATISASSNPDTLVAPTPTTLPADQAPPSEDKAEDDKAPDVTTPEAPEPNPVPSPPAAHTSNPGVWGYLGWYSSNPVADRTEPPATNTTTTTITTAQPSNDSTTGDEDGKEVHTIAGETPTENGAADGPPAPPQDLPLAEALTGAQVTKSDVVQRQSGASWLYPWTWYDGTSAPSSTPAPTSTSDEPHLDSDPKPDDVQPAKEEILPTPLASDLNPTTAVTSVPPATASSELNPISSSSSGWTTFWSSRVVASNIKAKIEGGKMITNGEQDGMEVMDVPDDVDSNGRAPQTPDTQATEKNGTPKPREEQANETDAKEDRKMRLVRQAPPLIVSEDVRKEVSSAPVASASPNRRNRKGSNANSLSLSRQASSSADNFRSVSPTPSKKSIASPTAGKQPKTPALPNLVLPSFQSTFHSFPRSQPPPKDGSTGGKLVERLGGFVRGVLFNTPEDDLARHSLDRKAEEERWRRFATELPKAWSVVESEGPKPNETPDILRGSRKVVVVGIHGWFPGAMMRSVIGEPTGTSTKFASMMASALEEFQDTHHVKFEKITSIPLEGEGTIEGRVEKLYKNLTTNAAWMADLYEADVIFVATHSQGSIVSTHILDKLYRDGHILAKEGDPLSEPLPTSSSMTFTSAEDASISPPAVNTTPNLNQPRQRKLQRVCCLALCGIHLGPLRYLANSSAFQGYIQYFESVAARQLFEFQNADNKVSKEYAAALERVLDHQTKMVFIASLNDQVVPIYSGLFTTAQHPLILRALYIDGDAYNNYDYISNLLVLLIKVLNSGVSDSGLLAHLSEATAGSLNGVGHSTAYEELANFRLAVDYMFLTDNGRGDHPKLTVDHFNAALEQNDYEIPWSLRDLIADDRVAHYFADDILDLREQFKDWHPKTSILRDMKRKLGPIQRLPPEFKRGPHGASPQHSKL